MLRKRLFFFFLILIFSSPGISQVIADKTIYDLGEIDKNDKHYVDFQLTNASSTDIRILKHETPYGISIRYSDKTISPDESIYVRIKYTPRRKGTFKADVPIWVSSNNEPIVLTIAGKAMTFDINESMEVPEFTQAQSKEHPDVKDFSFKVVRKSDGSEVEGARVDIIWDGVMYKTLYTNPSGRAKAEIMPDNYYLVVYADNLGGYEASLDLGNNIRELIIELGPQGTLTSVEEDSIIIVAEEPYIEPEHEDPLIEEPMAKEDTIAEQEPVKKEAPVKVYENPNFSDDEFVANNIVFLIDVSVSMKQGGRMDLLKASMIELTNLLRSRDKVAIVAYSSKAEIALKSTPASNKSEIIAVIKSLEPKGSTSGERGLRKAYQVLESNKIEGGNNQIFISTDGAFNLDKQDKALLDMVTKNASKGYKVSVIGIRNTLGTVKNMKRIADEGHGNYLHISNYNSARSTLVEEVKLQSKNSP